LKNLISFDAQWDQLTSPKLFGRNAKSEGNTKTFVLEIEYNFDQWSDFFGTNIKTKSSYHLKSFSFVEKSILKCMFKTPKVQWLIFISVNVEIGGSSHRIYQKMHSKRFDKWHSSDGSSLHNKWQRRIQHMRAWAWASYFPDVIRLLPFLKWGWIPQKDQKKT
jgi:hypothetical protein